MRQYDLASATALASRKGGSGVLTASFIAARERSALAALLPDFKIERHLLPAGAERSSAIIASFDSRHRARARRRAAALGIPFLVLGGGVLRAPPGWAGAAPKLSVTAHSMTGPRSAADFLDAHRLLASRGWESSELLARAAGARGDIVSRRLGGAWWNSGIDPGLPRHDGLAVIVATEANGLDANEVISAALLREMFAAALAENAPHQVVLLAAGAGRLPPLRDFLREATARGCTVVTRPTDSWEAIERAGCVYAAGSETGFLALLAGIQVRCFADSFYSGWGITADSRAIPRKPFRRTADEVFAGACFLATRYLDPYHLKAASLEDTLEIIAEWRKIETANRSVAVCVGMSFWKRRQVSDFLRSSAGMPAFRRTARAALATARARPGGTIAVWASRTPASLEEAAEHHGVPLIRVEDGFVRSVGLGSDFMPAASLVLDSHGMHFDPKVHSDLDRLLVETEFDPALIARARHLIGQLVTRGVTKYNLGKAALSIEWPAAKRRILVPGQVEDDLSVRLGGEGIVGNLDLLARVRAANPDAFILYKPHPDVEAGHRKGRILDKVARHHADIVIREVSTAALLAQIDELHTLTSLAGFEALLRGRRVVVYGRPFYAGWGLTTDLAEIDRGRRLALEELVAGALILYPRYLDPVTRLPCGPELVIERLEDSELWRPGPLVLARRLQGLLVRRWRELAANIAKLPAGAFQPFRRDGPRTPQIR